MKRFLSSRVSVFVVLVCSAMFLHCGAGNSASSVPTLTQITVTPATKSIAKGTTLQLSATGTYSDLTQKSLNSLVTWQVSPSALATVDAQGNLKAVAQGVAQVSATYQSVSGSASITIGPAALLQISIGASQFSLPVGESESLTATGSYTDGTTQNLSNSVTWQASPENLVTISSGGTLKALSVGSVQLSATSGGVTGDASFTVAPAALLSLALSVPKSSLPLGESEALVANGTYSDSTVKNLTQSVTWQISPSTRATIDNKGNLTAINQGAVQVSATYQGVTTSAQVTVDPAALLSISISAPHASLPRGESESLVVTGTYSDTTTGNLTHLVSWQITPPNAAKVDGNGNLTGLSQGTVEIAAAYQGVSGSTQITVAPAALLSISVSVPQSSLPLGESEALVATGTYSDASQKNLTQSVTWHLTPPTLATIDSKGNLTGVGQGAVQIAATYQGISGSAKLTVAPPALLGISIGAPRSSLPVGESESLAANGTYSDKSVKNLTQFVTWQLAPPNMATIDNTGNLTGMNQGPVQVSAAYQGVTGSAQITVAPAALLSLSISPAQSALPLGESELLVVTGTYSDTTLKDVTPAVGWQITPSNVATVDKNGNVTAVSQGTVQISATYKGMSTSAKVTVGPIGLVSISVSASQSSLSVGGTEAMTASGTFSDGSIKDVTQSVTWNASPSTIATINGKGQLQGTTQGVVQVSAAYQGIAGFTPVIVGSITGISINPSNTSLLVGSSRQLQAIAAFGDKSTQNITSTATWTSGQPTIVNVVPGGLVSATQVGSATITAQQSGFEGTGTATVTVNPLMTVSYYNRANAVSAGSDGTLELINPGVTQGNICAMIYVFDDKQELNECCGCKISADGMLTLSLVNDLTANPLTGTPPTVGVIEVVPSNLGANGLCNAGSPSPNSVITGTQTNVQADFELTEIPTASATLGAVQAQALSNSCAALQHLGSGAGICTCGIGN